MDFEAIFQRFIIELQSDPLFAIVVLIIAGLVVYRRPRFFIGIFLLGVLLIGVYYFILAFSAEGVSEKEKMLRDNPVPENSLPRPLNSGTMKVPPSDFIRPGLF